jgi:hypothetical protein
MLCVMSAQARGTKDTALEAADTGLQTAINTEATVRWLVMPNGTCVRLIQVEGRPSDSVEVSHVTDTQH